MTRPEPRRAEGTCGGQVAEGALARVENRLAYGMIADDFDLAAPMLS